MRLEEVDSSAWLALEGAPKDPQSGFRFVDLCSVDLSGRPQARVVVLRRVDRLERLVEIHTDTRSQKWVELSNNPIATILGFCASARVQLRLSGTVRLHPPGSDLANHAWSKLSSWTRGTYAGGPPGDEPNQDEINSFTSGADADGKAFFGVVLFQAESLDWFELGKPTNRRAILDYDNAGVLTASRWVNP